jgi:hypothetical protein
MIFIIVIKIHMIINHEILSKKLYSLGITGVGLKLIMSCLYDREYFVQVENVIDGNIVVGKSERRKLLLNIFIVIKLFHIKVH